jgi:hypothetical protein
VTKVTGTVKLTNGSAVVGATVEVHNSTGDTVDQIRTTGDGTFTYYLSPGEWTFKTYDTMGHRGTEGVILNDGDATVSVTVKIG